ncbi:MAG TPA: hypothetical protein VF590_16375 [Isosphaeraceae bacterium]|jgi:hypothetical protein
MTTDVGQVILSSGNRGRLSIFAAQVHHRDFPEIQAQGESPLRAAHRLILLLDRALDGANPWHREAIEQAQADVRSFIGTCPAVDLGPIAGGSR